MDDYLAQWLINDCGGSPVKFRKNSAETDLLRIFLSKKPLFARPDKPGPGKIPIALPFFKNMNMEVQNYLSKEARRALLECIRQRFLINLWSDLYKFGNIGKRKQDLIWAWMSTHGIELTETNWNTISKIYKRKRDIYRRRL